MISRVPTNRSRKYPRLTALLSTLFLILPILASTSSFALTQPKPVPDNPYGVNLFLHKEVEPWKLEETLRMVAEANIAWVKQEFPWQEIEFKKNYFYDDKWQKSAWEKFDRMVDLADKYHINVVARVDHPPGWAKAEPGGTSPIKSNADLAEFVNALLEHYKGRIKHVQIWNEPNLTGEWVPGKAVDPKAYVDMLKEVYPAVKAAHPDAVLLSAPLAMTTEGRESRGNMNEIDYWNEMYAAGVKGNFDIASANAYGLDQPPEAPPAPNVLNFRRVELLRDIMVKNGDESRPIWFDEFGWNAPPDSLPEAEKNYWRHVTPQQQADWTVAGVEYARKNWPWAGVVSIWYFRQVGDIPPEKAEYYFGMVNPDFSPQPVYNAVKAAAAKYPGPIGQPAGTPVNPAPSRTKAVVSPTKPAVPTTTLPKATTVATATMVSIPLTSTTTLAQVTSTVAPSTATLPQVTSTAGMTPSPQITSVAPTSTPAANTAGASDSNMLLYVLGGTLVLAGLGGLGYYYMRGRGNTVTSDQ